MKKTILWSALFTALCVQAHAQTTPASTAMPTSQPIVVPAATAPESGSTLIDCNYKIDGKTKTMDSALVQTWAENATLQTFDLDAKNIDNQMNKLKNCFTDQGWIGFTAALEQSGNLKTIKAQQLSVSSQIDGPIHADELKDGVWKFTLPVQVLYQNEKEKVTQLLSVKITIGHKATGLGITQLVAEPRNTSTAASSPSKDSNAAASPTITSSAPDGNAGTTPGASDTNGTTQPNPSAPTPTQPLNSSTTSSVPK